MRWLVLAAAAFSLSGCGLPPIVTYVSTAADIVSYLVTEKSVADHGISLVLQKDCALLRVLDGQICIEEAEEVVLSDCVRFETSPDPAGTRDGPGKGAKAKNFMIPASTSSLRRFSTNWSMRNRRTNRQRTCSPTFSSRSATSRKARACGTASSPQHMNYVRVFQKGHLLKRVPI